MLLLCVGGDAAAGRAERVRTVVPVALLETSVPDAALTGMLATETKGSGAGFR